MRVVRDVAPMTLETLRSMILVLMVTIVQRIEYRVTLLEDQLATDAAAPKSTSAIKPPPATSSLPHS